MKLTVASGFKLKLLWKLVQTLLLNVLPACAGLVLICDPYCPLSRQALGGFNPADEARKFVPAFRFTHSFIPSSAVVFFFTVLILRHIR